MQINWNLLGIQLNFTGSLPQMIYTNWAWAHWTVSVISQDKQATPKANLERLASCWRHSTLDFNAAAFSGTLYSFCSLAFRIAWLTHCVATAPSWIPVQWNLYSCSLNSFQSNTWTIKKLYYNTGLSQNHRLPQACPIAILNITPMRHSWIFHWWRELSLFTETLYMWPCSHLTLDQLKCHWSQYYRDNLEMKVHTSKMYLLTIKLLNLKSA